MCGTGPYQTPAPAKIHIAGKNPVSGGIDLTYIHARTHAHMRTHTHIRTHVMENENKENENVMEKRAQNRDK